MLESKEGHKVPDVEFRARHAHEWIDLSSSELISMLVRDGVVEKMFVEPEVEGDPYEVSDADTTFGHIAPAAHKPAEATIFRARAAPTACGNRAHDFSAGLHRRQVGRRGR